MKLTAEGIAVIEGDTYLSQEIIDKKRLDVAKDFLEQFHKYIPTRGIVFDVGASLGDYTMTFLEMVGPSGLVVAFEPNLEVYECLKFNLSAYNNKILYDCGLGKEIIANASIERDSNNIGASRLVLDGQGTSCIRSLDSIAYKCSRPIDFLKIDAEGFEPMILDGAHWTLEIFRPVMLIEVNTWPLGKLGFTAEDVFSRLDKLEYIFDRFDGPYGDILCLPKERHGLPI